MSPLRLTAAGAVAAACFGLPAAASAHVTVNPREMVEGSYSIMNVRVPNERDDKGTRTVDLRLPAGFYSVSYKKVAGWKVRVTRSKLSRPVKLGDDFEVDEQVTRIVWTTSRRQGGIIEPGQYEEFPLSVRVPNGAAGSTLMFKAYQTYEGGERVRWSKADPEADTPAPRVRLLAAPARTAQQQGG